MRDPDALGQEMPTEFPATVTVEAEPGDYYAIVCFQRSDSPLGNCMGPEDRIFFYDDFGSQLDLVAGMTTTISVELAE